MTVQLLLPGVLADLAGGSRHLDVEVPGSTVGDLLDCLAAVHPMLARRIRDETGTVRRFVNVYVDGEDVRYSDGLATTVKQAGISQGEFETCLKDQKLYDQINGAREKAPGHGVKAGDVLTIGLDHSVRVLKVIGFAERRGDASAARVLYDDLQARPE